jgi:hypothetical protein
MYSSAVGLHELTLLHSSTSWIALMDGLSMFHLSNSAVIFAHSPPCNLLLLLVPLLLLLPGAFELLKSRKFCRCRSCCRCNLSCGVQSLPVVADDPAVALLLTL